ncbi:MULTISPECIES: preprotein translocase subunit SecG [Salinivibrio]|uniref:Protein-export membrane protein SecG n=1 Tax=Salinivibrio costicola TaxID=51367 RepID=A0ABX6K7B0_SALCS|nr:MULTISPECIES: preprotein translocase subunit SecG [Salinivibrio]ODP98437.1 preprotein translocase subunit SecG [Salinivibrio sp. DV]OOF10638.1 preprotein translocase subunit SecG [Salinivibrio sp. PR5]OOF22284.1 preprotein translocase subunit SecG [Salinivibrio sp. IB574]OOF26740.1 preprotein translocase subunit SecG [Salinivibrio sp. IB872]QIR06879.1 preprotein translocase subunit SecG [Salinivibrio costicola]
MYEILLVIYLLAAIGVIGLVLVQQGKGADMGASFGAGASNTVFGSGGSGNFLTRMTTGFAIAFFALSLVLGNMTAHKPKAQSGFEDLSQPAVEQQATQTENEIPVDNSEIPQ